MTADGLALTAVGVILTAVGLVLTAVGLVLTEVGPGFKVSPRSEPGSSMTKTTISMVFTEILHEHTADCMVFAVILHGLALKSGYAWLTAWYLALNP